MHPFSIQLSVHGTKHLRRAYKKCTLCRCRYYGTRAVVTMFTCRALMAPQCAFAYAAQHCCIDLCTHCWLCLHDPFQTTRSHLSHGIQHSQVAPSFGMALSLLPPSQDSHAPWHARQCAPQHVCTTSSSQCTHSVLLELRRLANTMRLLRECTCLLIKSLHTHTNTTSVMPQQAILALRHCKLCVGVLICSLAHVWHA